MKKTAVYPQTLLTPDTGEMRAIETPMSEVMGGLLLPSPGLAMKAHPDSVCFGTVVDEAFLEPGVLQGLFGSDSLLGVVDKDLLEEVQECTVEGGINRDELLLRRVRFSSVGRNERGLELTVSAFIRRTYLRDARVVSLLG